MGKAGVMEKHTDENVYDGATGKWSRRPRTINDNVCHGGGWWTTQGAEGIENAAVIGAILYPKADIPFPPPGDKEATKKVADGKSAKATIGGVGARKGK